MGSFSVAGYFFDLPHDFCTLFVYKNHEVSQKRFKSLAVFVKITASRSSHLFLQQTVTNPIMSQNKAINKNLWTFNFMQNKKRLIANILRVKTFDLTRINFLQHIKKLTARLLSVKSIGHVNLRSSEDPP